MPVSAETLSKLMDAGLAGEALIDVVASIDADMAAKPAAIDEAAERRRAKDRERKRTQKAENSAEFRGNSAESPSRKENTPTPPKENTPPQKKTPPKGGQKEKGSPLEVSRAVEVWREVCVPVGMPDVMSLNDKRRRQLAARLGQHGLDGWRAACVRAANSAHCRGENNRGWRCNLDFLSSESGFTKTMEGNYDDRAGTDRRTADRRRAWSEAIDEANGRSPARDEGPLLAAPSPGGSASAPRRADTAHHGPNRHLC